MILDPKETAEIEEFNNIEFAKRAANTVLSMFEDRSTNKPILDNPRHTQKIMKELVDMIANTIKNDKTIEFYYYDDEVDPLTAQIAQILDANISRNFKITVKKGYIGEDYTEQKENNRHGLK